MGVVIPVDKEGRMLYSNYGLAVRACSNVLISYHCIATLFTRNDAQYHRVPKLTRTSRLATISVLSFFKISLMNMNRKHIYYAHIDIIVMNLLHHSLQLSK